MRYFFHITDGHVQKDEVGTELPSAEEAKQQALQMAGAMLSDNGNMDWDSKDWTLHVTDDQDRVIRRVTFVVDDS